MKLKKRKKSSRYRGTHTHGRGFKKKARGKGHRGGKGMAGTGKRADQKKSLVINLYGDDYFGKDKTLRRKPSKKLDSINIQDIVENLSSYIKRKVAKEEKEEVIVDLRGYKILADGKPDRKLIIRASRASQGAINKIKKSGGNIILE